jgi:hypothetical protein
MNTKNNPKITANNSNSKKTNHFSKPEIMFKTKEELQSYLVDSTVKNKRRSFNMSIKLT